MLYTRRTRPFDPPPISPGLMAKKPRLVVLLWCDNCWREKRKKGNTRTRATAIIGSRTLVNKRIKKKKKNTVITATLLNNSF